ncbi:MAG: glutathione S-transferase family protein [Caulobacteraceae bacterium]
MIAVHSIPGSPYGRAVLIACREAGATHRLAPLKPGESKGPAHLARHPFGRVPAIEDDGFALYETQAILRYLDAAYGDGALTPADPKAEARMNQAMGVIDCYFFTREAAVGVVFNRLVAPRIGMPTDEAAVEAALPGARHVTAVLAGFLEKSPYMAGETFSLADIHAGAHLDMLSETPEGAAMLKGTPIVPWLKRLADRPSFAATTWDRLLEAA